MKYRSAVVTLFLSTCLAGCADNMTNIRSLSSSIGSLTTATSNAVAGDRATCAEKSALELEYSQLEHQSLTPINCDDLSGELDAMLVENKAMQAYGSALGSMAQDQFVSANTDQKSVTDALSGAKAVTAPVASAIGTVFGLVETAALQGYRQHELSVAMTGAPAAAFKTITENDQVLAQQYEASINTEKSNLVLIGDAVVHDHSKGEPLAAYEFQARLKGLDGDLDSKLTAIKAYEKAISSVDRAFDAAAKDIQNPSPKEIYQEVATFAENVHDADEKLSKAMHK